MDTSKKASFVNAYGKKRTRFAKGGMVRGRKYFDGGGTILSGPGNSMVNPNAVNPNTGVAGTVNGIFGLNDNYQAGTAQINPGTNTAQLNNAYSGAQGALGNQNQIVQQLQPQIPQAVSEQNAVAQSAEEMLNGTGPNPAQTQLATATGNNVATTTAEMAGMRGASVNPGLIAREAAQQGAATQQGAAGQAATLGAEQQIAAQGTLANLAENQVSQTGQAVTNQNNAQQNEQSVLQNANTSENNAAVGMQSNINNTNSATAAANQNQAGNMFGGMTSAVSALAPLAFAAKGGEIHDNNEHLRLAEMNAHSLKHAKKFDSGGSVIQENPLTMNRAPSSQSNLGVAAFGPMAAGAGPNIQSSQALPDSSEDFGDDVDNAAAKMKKSPSDSPMTDAFTMPDIGSSAAPTASSYGLGADLAFAHGGMAGNDNHFANYFSGGGNVAAMVSAGEVYLNPEQVRKVIHEDADPAKIGTKIKARNASQKATVRGDSLKNDKIPMTLQDGGVVVDRKNMGSSDKRKLFVHRALARKKAGA